MQSCVFQLGSPVKRVAPDKWRMRPKLVVSTVFATPACTKIASAPPFATWFTTLLMSPSPSIGPAGTPWSIGTMTVLPSSRNIRPSLRVSEYSSESACFSRFHHDRPGLVDNRSLATARTPTMARSPRSNTTGTDADLSLISFAWDEQDPPNLKTCKQRKRLKVHLRVRERMGRVVER